MIDSFVDLNARHKRIRLSLASGAERTGMVCDVADDGGWLLLEDDTGRHLCINCAQIDYFELLEG